MAIESGLQWHWSASWLPATATQSHQQSLNCHVLLHLWICSCYNRTLFSPFFYPIQTCHFKPLLSSRNFSRFMNSESFVYLCVIWCGLTFIITVIKVMIIVVRSIMSSISGTQVPELVHYLNNLAKNAYIFWNSKIKKLKCRQIKWFAGTHTANKWQK